MWTQIPVYLSKTLAENLYLLQYPVKASTATFDDGQVVNSCVKPINQQVGDLGGIPHG